jgi:hypothetical protein
MTKISNMRPVNDIRSFTSSALDEFNAEISQAEKGLSDQMAARDAESSSRKEGLRSKFKWLSQISSVLATVTDVTPLSDLKQVYKDALPNVAELFITAHVDAASTPVLLTFNNGSDKVCACIAGAWLAPDTTSADISALVSHLKLTQGDDNVVISAPFVGPSLERTIYDEI